MKKEAIVIILIPGILKKMNSISNDCISGNTILPWMKLLPLKKKCYKVSNDPLFQVVKVLFMNGLKLQRFKVKKSNQSFWNTLYFQFTFLLNLIFVER